MLHSRMLNYLDEVTRAGSIRKAAVKLNISSTAINRQIIALEQELGEQIFERMPRRLRLTAAGEVLIEHVRETLKGYERLRQHLDELKGMQRGRIAVATTPGLASGPLPRIVNDYIAQHPRIRVALKVLIAEGILNAVLAGDVTLGLGFNLRRNPQLRTLLSFDVPVGAVVCPDHPLTRRRNVQLSEVVGYPMVLAEPRMYLRNAIDLALARLSFTAQPVIETNSIEMMKQVVGVSRSVTFLNPIDCFEDCAAGRLRYIPLAEMQVEELNLVTRLHTSIDPASNGFIDYLERSLNAKLDSVR